MRIDKIIFPILLVAVNMGVLAQEKVPKTRGAQSITISDSVFFEYTKPGFFDMIKYLKRTGRSAALFGRNHPIYQRNNGGAKS